MTEVDESLKDVGSNRPRHAKHKLVEFATQHFNRSAAEDTTYKSISCRRFTLSTTLEGPNATVDIEVFIFKENGTFTIANDAEDYSVKRGTVKLNVNIKNWRFCGKAAGEDNQCKKGNTVQEGKYVLFVFSIQGKDEKAPKKKAKAPGQKGRKKAAYELNGGECIVSGEVRFHNGQRDKSRIICVRYSLLVEIEIHLFDKADLFGSRVKLVWEILAKTVNDLLTL